MKGTTVATALLAAALSGCGGVPFEYEKHGDMSSKPGMFGDRLTFRTDLSTPTAQPASAAEQEDFKKWRESTGRSERQEFEDWRAWQEWKRQNRK